MVATATPRFGFEPKLCLAGPMLWAALECYERGDYIGCGVRLRASVLRFLTAMADWHAVKLPKSHKPLRPTQLSRALHIAAHGIERERIKEAATGEGHHPVAAVRNRRVPMLDMTPLPLSQNEDRPSV